MSIRLDMNTNGAWRTVLRSINPNRMQEVKDAASFLVAQSVKQDCTGGIKFRRFCDESMKVIDYCGGSEGTWYEPELRDGQ